MEPLRIGILTSHRMPGLRQLLEDPNRNVTWELTLVVGSEPSLPDLPLLEKAKVPVELRPIRQISGFRNLNTRESYDDELGELFARGKVDYVFLVGYDYIVTGPLLERYRGRVIGIHDADLTQRENDRLFAGTHAVRDAILAGEPEIRSSVYLVTRDVGRGPLLLLGAPYRLALMALDARESGSVEFLEAYAALHREWMVSTCWGPMLRRTLEMLVAGSMKTVGDVVWVDGAPGPCRMGEAPRDCLDPEAMIARGIPRSCPFIAG